MLGALVGEVGGRPTAGSGDFRCPAAPAALSACSARDPKADTCAPVRTRAKSLKHSPQAPDVAPERAGKSSHHAVVTEWAAARGCRPAPGTEQDGHLGVRRSDFREMTEGLQAAVWDERFATFTERRLDFVRQANRSDGSQSDTFLLESPDRENNWMDVGNGS